MTVKIDEEECMGCESCVEICPEVFGFNEDETKAYVIEGADMEANADCIEESIGACPAACITND